jgi:hypothetical protein
MPYIRNLGLWPDDGHHGPMELKGSKLGLLSSFTIKIKFLMHHYLHHFAKKNQDFSFLTLIFKTICSTIDGAPIVQPWRQRRVTEENIFFA